MVVFVTVIHVFVSLIMMLFILLQEGKEGMGSIGGGVGSSPFASRSRATPLSRLTAVAATTFMITSLTLAWLSSRDHSVIGSAAVEPPASSAPATTGGAAPAAGAAAAGTKAAGQAAPAEAGKPAEGSTEAAPAKAADKAPAAQSEGSDEGDAPAGANE